MCVCSTASSQSSVCMCIHLYIHIYAYYIMLKATSSKGIQQHLNVFNLFSVCACSCLKVVGVFSLGRQIFHQFAFCAAARQTKINSLKIVLTILVFWHTPKRPLKRNVQRHKHMCLLASLCAYKYVNMYIYASVCSEMLSELCANTPQTRK